MIRLTAVLVLLLAGLTATPAESKERDWRVSCPAFTSCVPASPPTRST
jgi:hypothetical protein